MIGIVRVVLIALVVAPALYGICYSGDQVTQRFGDVGDAIYQLTWYELPLDMQKNIPTMIAIAHKGVYVRGNADIRTTCQILRKVCVTTSNKLKKIDNFLLICRL